jgi:eukaryotic translation initiation factor 2C
VKYRGNQNAGTRLGSWNMMNNIRFTSSPELRNWTFLWISAQGNRDPWNTLQELKSPIDGFTATLRTRGINASPCAAGMHITVNPSNFEADIDNAIHTFTSTPGKTPPKLILVILPFDRTPIYDRVKFACDVKEGILNVCVIAQKFARANDQYHSNVALKFNLKLGGQNQILDSSKLGILAEGKTMVVGLDVTHPAPGSPSSAPSVASIVASVDTWFAQWPGDLRIQTGRQEMVSDLEGLCKSRLKLWRDMNGIYPENILVYRDGVSEGQYNIVLEKELPALRKACEDVYPAASTKDSFPRITIIIVGKRHNTRFYVTKKEDADRSSNPQNGTVIDRGVTEARNWDFFLQSHTAIQGTARPAHYYIVYDQIFRAQKARYPFATVADVLEDLTHNLCYLFGRATKSVSICPPAYYADLACERARCYLGGLLDPSPAASPTASVISGQTGGSGQADPSRVRIHDNVKNSMFYI